MKQQKELIGWRPQTQENNQSATENIYVEKDKIVETREEEPEREKSSPIEGPLLN